MSQYEKLWDRVWRTSDQQDIRFQKAATYDIDGYVIGRRLDDNTVYVVAQLTGMQLGNVSYADGKSVSDTAAFNANWTILAWNGVSSTWYLSFALDWQIFIQSIFAVDPSLNPLSYFLYMMRGSSVAVVNTDKDNVQYYQIGTQFVLRDLSQGHQNVEYCAQWYLSDAPLDRGTMSFEIEQSYINQFYLVQADGSRLALGRAIFTEDDSYGEFALPVIPPALISLDDVQSFINNDYQIVAPEYPLIRIGMTADPTQTGNYNGRTSNFASVCLQVVTLSPKAAGMFLDMFPRYKKMCCAGPIDQDLQGLLCGQYTVDGGPGNNANCDYFMSQEWCTGDQLNQPECACQDQALITDEIDNDIFTALDGSRPKRCVVGACQRAYIPSDTLNRTCTPLCVQVAKATADCGGTIRYTVQQSLDCGNPNN